MDPAHLEHALVLLHGDYPRLVAACELGLPARRTEVPAGGPFEVDADVRRRDVLACVAGPLAARQRLHRRTTRITSGTTLLSAVDEYLSREPALRPACSCAAWNSKFRRLFVSSGR